MSARPWNQLDAELADTIADVRARRQPRTPKAGGRLLDGRTWDEMPA